VIAAHLSTGLTYEAIGSGTPVVFLHGLTFDRGTWRPIIDRLDGSVQSLAIDLPTHGESGGKPAAPPDIADLVHDLLTSLTVERPVVVGHSISAAVAFAYASAHPTRGIVVVDQGTHVRPFAELLHRLEPALRGPGFAEAWKTFEDSLGLSTLRSRCDRSCWRRTAWTKTSCSATGRRRCGRIRRRSKRRSTSRSRNSTCRASASSDAR
jgi:pimeloyl-ACP methyl ester carboxylesterase